jgi:hypothetical protein
VFIPSITATLPYLPPTISLAPSGAVPDPRAFMFAFKPVDFTSSAIGSLACCFSVYAYPKPESTPSPTSPAFPLPTLSSADDALRTYPSILLRRLRHPLCVRVLPRTWSVSSPLHERPRKFCCPSSRHCSSCLVVESSHSPVVISSLHPSELSAVSELCEVIPFVPVPLKVSNIGIPLYSTSQLKVMPSVTPLPF